MAVQEPLFEVQVQPERRYFRQILDALTRSGFGADPLEAELTVSKLFGTVWAAQTGDRAAAEESFGHALVEFARQHRTPTSVALLRTVAAVAPIREVRLAAAAAADRLVESGLPEPAWPRPAGDVTAGRCWSLDDVYGDMAVVICEYAYGDVSVDERHGTLVEVDHVSFSAAVGAAMLREVDVMVRDLFAEAARERPMLTLRQVDQAAARALLERAFARTDLIDEVTPAPGFGPVRAFVLARLRALGDVHSLPFEAVASHAAPGPIVEEFLASPEAADLADTAYARSVAELIVEFGAERDPADVARVGPAKWEAFLAEWLPKRSVDRQAAAPVIRAWSTWAGRRAGLPDRARDELARLLERQLDQFLA